MFGLLDEEWPCGDHWADSSLSLPDRGRAWQLRNVFDNQMFDATDKLELATILSHQPIALLVYQP
jgi:maltooligosyltrehalose synthase